MLMYVTTKLGVVITPQVRPNEAKPSEVFSPRLSQKFSEPRLNSFDVR